MKPILLNDLFDTRPSAISFIVILFTFLIHNCLTIASPIPIPIQNPNQPSATKQFFKSLFSKCLGEPSCFRSMVSEFSDDEQVLQSFNNQPTVTSFQDLPAEMILEIAQRLPHMEQSSSLARTNRANHDVLSNRMPEYNAYKEIKKHCFVDLARGATMSSWATMSLIHYDSDMNLVSRQKNYLRKLFMDGESVKTVVAKPEEMEIMDILNVPFADLPKCYEAIRNNTQHLFTTKQHWRELAFDEFAFKMNFPPTASIDRARDRELSDTLSKIVETMRIILTAKSDNPLLNYTSPFERLSIETVDPLGSKGDDYGSGRDEVTLLTDSEIASIIDVIPQSNVRDLFISEIYSSRREKTLASLTNVLEANGLTTLYVDMALDSSNHDEAYLATLLEFFQRGFGNFNGALRNLTIDFIHVHSLEAMNAIVPTLVESIRQSNISSVTLRTLDSEYWDDETNQNALTADLWSLLCSPHISRIHIERPRLEYGASEIITECLRYRHDLARSRSNLAQPSAPLEEFVFSGDYGTALTGNLNEVEVAIGQVLAALNEYARPSLKKLGVILQGQFNEYMSRLLDFLNGNEILEELYIQIPAHDYVPDTSYIPMVKSFFHHMIRRKIRLPNLKKLTIELGRVNEDITKRVGKWLKSDHVAPNLEKFEILTHYYADRLFPNRHGNQNQVNNQYAGHYANANPNNMNANGEMSETTTSRDIEHDVVDDDGEVNSVDPNASSSFHLINGHFNQQGFGYPSVVFEETDEEDAYTAPPAWNMDFVDEVQIYQQHEEQLAQADEDASPRTMHLGNHVKLEIGETRERKVWSPILNALKLRKTTLEEVTVRPPVGPFGTMLFTQSDDSSRLLMWIQAHFGRGYSKLKLLNNRYFLPNH